MTALWRVALVLLSTLTDPADSVRQTFREYERCLNAGEYAKLIEFYADDPRFYWVAEGVVITRDDMARQLSHLSAAAHLTYGDPRITIVDSNVALLSTSYTGVMGTAKFSGYMTITLIRTPAGWRFLAGQS